MAQILVRDLEEDVVKRLKKRARAGGRSLQSEVKSILVRAAREPGVDVETARGLVLDIRKKLTGRDFPDSADLVREDRRR